MRTLLLFTLLVSAPALGAPAPLDSIPAGAVLAGAMRPASLELVRTYFGQTADMQRDLGEYFTRRLGVDLTSIDSVAFWSTELGQPGQSPTFAAYFHLTRPTAPKLKGAAHGSFDGVELVAIDKLVAALIPSGLIVGNEAEVKAGIAVARHHAPAIGPNSPLAALLSQDSADITMGLAASAIKETAIQGAVQQYGAQTVTLQVLRTGQIVLEILGDGSKLKSFALVLDTMMNMLIGQLKAQHDRALNDDSMEFADGLAAVAGYGQAQAFWKEATPRLEGNKLVARYQLPQLKTGSMVVPSIGIAAAVAIPAFMKYIRRSKTVEATISVRKLADAAASLAASTPANKLPRFAFPPSTGWTPAVSCCGQPGDKCAPNPKLWSNETFSALQFSIDDPFYYQYRVTSTGRGSKARITVEARGDLDCDQKTSSFKRTVTLDAQGQPTLGPLETADEIE